MKISSLNINNFRNFKNVRLPRLGRTVILLGPNASGKSNLIEILRYLTLTRSYKNIADKFLLTWKEQRSVINAKIKHSGNKFYLSFIFDKTRPARFKEIYLDQTLTTATAVLGKVKTLCFSIDDLNYFLDSPRARRKYFNILFCLYSQKYWLALSAYQKIIKHRNLILKQVASGRLDSLELGFWNSELVSRGAELGWYRQLFFNQLNTTLNKNKNIFNRVLTKDVAIKYSSNFLPDKPAGDENEIKICFLDKLKKAQDTEIRLKQTLAGPHRDQIELVLDGKNLRRFGSRGEIRLAVLSLKLAELDFLTEKFKTRPILLLDDILSELDENSRQVLNQIVGRQQTFITTTDLAQIDSQILNQAKILRINNGEIKEVRRV